MSAIAATLFAGLALQSAPMPGSYVGEWPLGRENRELWDSYRMGLLTAMFFDRPDDEPTPHVFAEPLFLDNRHICGVYMLAPDDDTQAQSYLAFIARLASLDFDDEAEARELAVEIVNRDASGAELDAHCPNIPDDMRADFFNAAERYRQPPTVFEPDGAGFLSGAQGRAMMHSLDAIMPEWPDGTEVWSWGFPVYRESALICGEYLLSTPSHRPWRKYWFIARLDTFEEPETGPHNWPVTMLNSDASRDEIRQTCPTFAFSSGPRSVPPGRVF